jgi:D-glycero-alpha-D-manno-heptose-7-phosphate kinase
MIVSKCPLRISLAGGSTDTPSFLKKYKGGRVISFTPKLYTYTSLHQDVNGFNNLDQQYLLSYSKFEKCSEVSEIKNELIKGVFETLRFNPIKLSLNADVFSLGSGLASSSSYIINLVSSYYYLKGLEMDNMNICRVANHVESKINPLNGYQDTYGCGLPGFKLMEFDQYGNVKTTAIESPIFDEFDFYLIYTGVKRKSTDILKTLNVTRSKLLLREVDGMYEALQNDDYDSFFKKFKNSWRKKKNTSDSILNTKLLQQMDKELSKQRNVLAHKLCGAGGGGYFLVIVKKDKKITLDKQLPYINISLDTEGFKTIKL